MKKIHQDQFGTVINHDETYAAIAEYLVEGSSLFIAWTDQEGTQLDLLINYEPVQYGHPQRGMSADTDLFVAVSHWGMFGFELNGAWKSQGYVGNKLGLGEENDTTKALADLINGVCRLLEQWRRGEPL